MRRVFDVPGAAWSIDVFEVNGGHVCKRLVVFQVDAQNLLGVVNRGTPRLNLNELARELFWFGLEQGITLIVEWFPREENEMADELSKESKLIIPDDGMLSRTFFRQLELRFGTHTVDLFSSGTNNQCERFYSLHWCRGTAGVNAFAFTWSGESAWVHCPFRLIGRVLRKLKHDGAAATMLVPLWESATWWGLVVPDAAHFSEEVGGLDWRGDPSLFIPGGAPGGREVLPPDWPIMAVRFDFSPGGDRRRIPLRDRCIHGGCAACRSLSWHR